MDLEKKLNEIELFVKMKLTTHKSSIAADNKTIIHFIEALRNSDNISCKRLLTCIGIDLKKYQKSFQTEIPVDCYIQALTLVILDTENIKLPLTYTRDTIPPSVQFAISLKNKHCFFLSKPLIKAEENTEYFRITTFSGFIQWIVKPNLAVNESLKQEIAEDVDDNELETYYAKLEKSKAFHKINISIIGSGTGWVFVGCYNDLKENIKQKKINDLVDCLGFYTNNIIKTADYVSIQYPENELLEPFYQPHTLTGDWGTIDGEKLNFGNDFFLSDGEHTDKWGRTKSVSGTQFDQKERVHLRFNHSTKHSYPFAVVGLGKLKTDPAQRKFEEILYAALERYDNA